MFEGLKKKLARNALLLTAVGGTAWYVAAHAHPNDQTIPVQPGRQAACELAISKNGTQWQVDARVAEPLTGQRLQLAEVQQPGGPKIETFTGLTALVGANVSHIEATVLNLDGGIIACGAQDLPRR